MALRELVTLISFRINRGQLNRANSAVANLARNTARIGTQLSVFATLPLAFAFRGLLGAATNIDLVRKSLDGMLGSAEAGERVMQGLFELARESPLIALKDVGKAAKTLIAQGFGEKGLVDTMKLLSTAASAFGSDLSLLSRNYAQVRAANRLMGRDLKDFENQMIPITDALADVLDVPRSQIRKMASESKIPFSAVEEAFRRIAGEGSKAAAIVKEIANTPFGKFAKFKDFVFEVSERLGKKLFPATIKLIGFATKLVAMFDRLSENTKRFVLILGGVAAALGPILLLFAGILALIGGPFAIAFLIAIGLLALFIEELVVWKDGGDAVLKDIFGDWEGFWKDWDKLFGNGLKDFESKGKKFFELALALKKAVRLIVQSVTNPQALIVTALADIAAAGKAVATGTIGKELISAGNPAFVKRLSELGISVSGDSTSAVKPSLTSSLMSRGFDIAPSPATATIDSTVNITLNGVDTTKSEEISKELIPKVKKAIADTLNQQSPQLEASTG